MASGYRDKIIWVILLGALVRREMSWKVRLVIFIDIIICPVLKCHVCRNWDAVKRSEARFLPLVLSCTLTSLQTLTVAKQNKSSAHVVNSKRGLICHMPPPPSPWLRRIKPGHGVFLSGSWFMGLAQRNKGSECVWSLQVKTQRRHFEKSSHRDWNLFNHTCHGNAT